MVTSHQSEVTKNSLHSVYTISLYYNILGFKVQKGKPLRNCLASRRRILCSLEKVQWYRSPCGNHPTSHLIY